MSAGLKLLAKDTVIYGVSSIVGRFLNYLLVPLYTAKFSVDSGGYGVVTHVYAITAFLLVLLVYGMETGFFPFANKEKEDEQTVYSTILLAVGSTSLIFIALCFLCLTPISSFLGYANNPEFMGMMAIVVAFDAFQCIPFAYLRHKKRPVKFAMVKLFFIVFNISLNLFFLLWCPLLYVDHPGWVSWFYNPAYGVGYVFLANLIATSLQMFCFIPELRGFRYRYNAQLMKRILTYSFPILI
ncbi:hypothetical protein EZS27_029336, partial [termite gut metagenome]